MRQETKEKLYKTAAIAAMVTPPWNLFWWTVGGTLYAAKSATDKDWDASGDGFLGLVLGAPVTLPLMPFMMLRERRELKEYERKQAQLGMAAEWIAARLRRYGITVVEACGSLGGVRVVAEPAPEQEAAFADVMAQAVRYFAGAGLTINQVCSSVMPSAPLNRAWAEQHGFDAWAEEIISPPCEECGERTSHGWHFGEVLDYAKDTERVSRHTVSFADGSTREVTHLCYPCLTKLGWTGQSTSYSDPDSQ